MYEQRQIKTFTLAGATGTMYPVVELTKEQYARAIHTYFPTLLLKIMGEMCP